MDDPRVKTVLQAYADRRDQAIREAEGRRREALERIPGLAGAEAASRLAGLSYARLSAMGRLEEAKAWKMEQEASLRNIACLLQEQGYPADWLEPVFYCSRCRDQGYLPNPGGAPSPVRCACLDQRIREEIARSVDIRFPPEHTLAAFDETLFSPEADPKKYGVTLSPRENVRWIRKRCQDFVRDFADPACRNLLFTGPTGTGKTFMANCIGRELALKGYDVIRLTAPQLFDRIIRGKFDGDGTYQDILDAELLIVDDLGVESQSAAKFSIFYDLLESRNRTEPEKICRTLLSTNFKMKELVGFYDERIISRLLHWYDILRFAGDDARLTLSARRRECPGS